MLNYMKPVMMEIVDPVYEGCIFLYNTLYNIWDKCTSKSYVSSIKTLVFLQFENLLQLGYAMYVS